MCNSNTDTGAHARSVILVAPQGSGKSTLAPTLMRALGLRHLVDEFSHSAALDSVPAASLVLTQYMPVHVPSGFEVMSLDQARAVVATRAPGT